MEFKPWTFQNRIMEGSISKHLEDNTHPQISRPWWPLHPSHLGLPNRKVLQGLEPVDMKEDGRKAWHKSPDPHG
jgi:hypothetical protein